MKNCNNCDNWQNQHGGRSKYDLSQDMSCSEGWVPTLSEITEATSCEYWKPLKGKNNKLMELIAAANEMSRLEKLTYEAFRRHPEHKKQNALMEIAEEYSRAILKHGKFHNQHEGFAVLQEEVCELWKEVMKRSRSKRQRRRAKREAIQIAAMALRFALDCCDDDNEETK